MEPLCGTTRFATTLSSSPDAATDDPQEWPAVPVHPMAARVDSGQEAEAGRRRCGYAPMTEVRYHPADVLEFMEAMYDYRQLSSRLFPTWAEVLAVLKSLGYAKRVRKPPAKRIGAPERLMARP